jgi:hypothetical protein
MTRAAAHPPRPEARPVDVLERLSRVVTLSAFAIGVGALFAAPLLALSWRQLPFPGFLIDQTLVVNSRSGSGWSGRQAGLAPPMVVIRMASVPVTSFREFHTALAGHPPGESISVFARLPDGQVRLFPAIELTSFSEADFLSLFWLPYVVGLAYLGIGFWVYLARGKGRPGRALAFFCICVAIAAGLLFDVLTSHRMTLIWVIAVAMLGGALISLAMRFPVEWDSVRSHPPLLIVPYLISIGLAIWAIYALVTPGDPWMYPEARSWAYRYTAVGCLTFFGVVIFRAPQSRDPAVRRQARLVLLGSLLAFTPIILWFLAPVFGIPLEFNSLLMMPVLLVFPLAVALAIMRYRLLEIDALVNRAIVYAVLTALLAGVFTAAISVSQRAFVALTGEKSDAAIVITTLIVAAAASPARSRLQTWVDRQFREVPTGPLRTFGDEVSQYLELNDPDLLARRLLAEAVHSLEAEAGAIVRTDDSAGPRTMATHGAWRGAALMSVPIESGGESFGLLMIGPRRNGKRYRRFEAEALLEVAGRVGRAMQIAHPPHSSGA